MEDRCISGWTGAHCIPSIPIPILGGSCILSSHILLSCRVAFGILIYIYIYTPLQPSDPLYSFLFAVFLLCVVFTRGLTLAPSQQCYWHGDIMHLHTTSAKNRDSITQRPSVQGREQVTVNGDPSSDRLKSWRSWQM